MRMLYMAHSGLRYLVLAVGLLAVVYFLLGLLTRKPVTRAVRVLGSSYVGLLDLQILLGLVLLVMGQWERRVIGHVVMMVLAAGVAHGLMVANRKRATPGWTLPLAAVGGSLLLIIGGIMAIGRTPFGSVAFGG